ncbi:MAG TPA: CopG family transcriptional regulator [Mycobacterium sp.]|uniref:CopG family transcriptional regulator n=1 Tax=Mycolicibacterium sp. TaxID=2320850 RepID=UPI0025EFFFB4|nr:CopG family transcriptional regulator [Mycolicibacterium sp.]HPX35115.1 CopG family transcriptional regulator [Mycobacterium sp.]HQC75529.1 CopG family transcriptional regulator [Mycobacterium sp.]
MSTTLDVQLSEDQAAKLRAAADRAGISVEAAALKAIDEYVNRHTRRRDKIIEQVFTEDTELFRRLAGG